MLGKAFSSHYSPINSIFLTHSPSRGLPSCSWIFLCVHPSRWESFSLFLHAQKFVLVLFSKWARNIYVFPAFLWILQWLGTVFTLLSGQEARFTFFGVYSSRFGSCIAIVVFRNKKYDLGFCRGRFWLYGVIKQVLRSYFSPWCFSPFVNPFFGFPNVFLKTNNWYFAVCAPFPWSKLLCSLIWSKSG